MVSFKDIINEFPQIKLNEPLDQHCSYRIGGPAQYFLEINNFDGLPELFNVIQKLKIKFYLLGCGTNVLFPDDGLKGLVIRNLTNQIEINEEEAVVQSGVEMGKLISYLKKNGLTGLENLCGLPGTIGGAIFGNAGRNGLEISKMVKKVEYFDSKKLKFNELTKKECSFAYRESIFKENPNWIITNIYLGLKKVNKSITEEQFQKTIKDFKKYPKGYSCGSFFKNPSPLKPAGKLIEECGLKGYQIGDARISEEHGNFIVNMGKAKTSDIIKLANLAEKRVKEKFGIKLEREVRMVKI